MRTNALSEHVETTLDLYRATITFRVEKTMNACTPSVHVRIWIKPNKHPLAPEGDREIVVSSDLVLAIRFRRVLHFVDLDG